jgi:hypothetical protein
MGANAVPQEFVGENRRRFWHLFSLGRKQKSYLSVLENVHGMVRSCENENFATNTKALISSAEILGSFLAEFGFLMGSKFHE